MVLSKFGLLHSYDFNCSSTIKPYYEELVEVFSQFKSTMSTNNDMTIPFNHPLQALLAPKIESIIEENFYVGKKLGPTILRVYIQNNKNGVHHLHSHNNTMGTVTGVFYYNVPKEGGEFLFRYLENNKIGEEKKIKVEENKLYIFPSWLPHMPLPQKDEKYRLCFNIKHPSNESAIHKETLTRF